MVTLPTTPGFQPTPARTSRVCPSSCSSTILARSVPNASPTRRQASVRISSRSSDFRASSPNLARMVCCRNSARWSPFSSSLKRFTPHSSGLRRVIGSCWSDRFGVSFYELFPQSGDRGHRPAPAVGTVTVVGQHLGCLPGRPASRQTCRWRITSGLAALTLPTPFWSVFERRMVIVPNVQIFPQRTH